MLSHELEELRWNSTFLIHNTWVFTYSVSCREQMATALIFFYEKKIISIILLIN
jgi:hypothetical protein